jgi:hypothetical protein
VLRQVGFEAAELRLGGRCAVRRGTPGVRPSRAASAWALGPIMLRRSPRCRSKLSKCRSNSLSACVASSKPLAGSRHSARSRPDHRRVRWRSTAHSLPACRIAPVVGLGGQRPEVLSGREEAVDVLAVVPRCTLQRNRSVRHADSESRCGMSLAVAWDLSVQRDRRCGDGFGRGPRASSPCPRSMRHSRRRRTPGLPPRPTCLSCSSCAG